MKHCGAGILSVDFEAKIIVAFAQKFFERIPAPQSGPTDCI